MTETLAVQHQNLDYYNYFVMCNYVFNEQKPVIENVYTYEENGVLCCASATQKGVYWYTYCLNNPLKYKDPTGNKYSELDDIWEVNREGRIINRIPDKTQDVVHIVDKDANGNYQRTYTTDENGNQVSNSISFPYGTIESQTSISFSPDRKTRDSYDVYKVRGDDNGTALFNFFAEHITGSPLKVEFSQAKTGIVGDRGLNFITTSHQANRESGMSNLLSGQLYYGYTIRELNHSHHKSPNPSPSDFMHKSDVINVLNSQKLHIPIFNLYHVPSKTSFPY